MLGRPRLRFIAGLLLAYALASAGAGVVVAEGTLHPMRRALTHVDEEQETAHAQAEGTNLRDVVLAAQDGALLQAWLLRPRHANGDVIILLHGLSDNRLGMAGYADLFLAHGYGVLMPDARAHGASGGAIATYGLMEADDVRRWVEWIRTTQASHCVYGFGESMGAAELLRALPGTVGFCAVAAESPFSSFREIAYDRMGQRFHTGPWLGRTLLRPLVEAALQYSDRKYHVDLQRVSTEESVAASQVPVFLIHGQDDDNIPIRHSIAISARNPRVVLWQVPHGHHANAISAVPTEFPARLLAFFASHHALAPN